ncbi:30S ribosomal protein S16 [Aeromicrobium sp.]
MAVKIRLKRMGKIRTPFYRIVVADSRTKRDGRVIEEIGTYNPKADPSVIIVVSDRAQYWLGVGAQPTEAVTALLKLTGDWESFTGEKQTRTLEVAAPKRDKAEIFDEALKDLHAGEAKSDATTKKAAAKKAEKKAEEPKADKAEEPKADKAEKKAEEAPAAEAPAAEASEEAKA